MLCEFIHSFSLCMHVCQKPEMHSRERDPVRVPALVRDIPTIRHVDAIEVRLYKLEPILVT